MKDIKFKKERGKVLTFKFKNNDLLLKTEPSTNKVGTVVNLYQDNGSQKIFVKTVGWLVDDGKSGSTTDKNTIIKGGITSIDKCKERVITYLGNLLS